MNRALIGLMIVVGLAFGSSPTTAKDLQAVEKEIAARWAKVQSLSATVKMEKSLHASSGIYGSSTQGTLLHLKKDGKELYRQDLKTERPSLTGPEMVEHNSTIIGDGTFLYLLTETDGLYRAYKNKQEGSNISTGGQSLMTYLERHFLLELLPDETVDGQETYVIEATPLTGVWKRKTRYYINKKLGFLVKRVALSTKGEEDTILTYSDVKTGMPIPADRFVFTPPKGVPVLDQTHP